MPLRVPECVAVSAWLGEWRLGRVARGDAANALEVITGLARPESGTWLEFVNDLDPTTAPFAPAVPEPGDPCGVPLAGVTQAVATSPTTLLVAGEDGSWRHIGTAHSVPLRSLTETHRLFTSTVGQAQEELAGLATTGSRAVAESHLASIPVLPLPASLPARNHAALDSAIRILAIVDAAVAHSSVPSSPSHDDRRVVVLRELRRSARDLMLASVTQ